MPTVANTIATPREQFSVHLLDEVVMQQQSFHGAFYYRDLLFTLCPCKTRILGEWWQGPQVSANYDAVWWPSSCSTHVFINNACVAVHGLRCDEIFLHACEMEAT